MPRTCTICTHADRAEIDRTLVASSPYRYIAGRFGTSVTALARHKADHLPAALAKAKDAEAVADADDLLTQVQDLRRLAMHLLAKASAAGDYRTALMGIREARACIETLLEVEEKIDRRPVVNLMIAPEWLAVRSALMVALAPYPEARTAVTGQLVALEAGR